VVAVILEPHTQPLDLLSTSLLFADLLLKSLYLSN